MTEIEIYTKIMEIVKDEEPAQALFALDFVRQRIQNSQYARENALYAKQAAANYVGSGTGLYPTPAFNMEKAAEDAVRKIAQEEIEKANPTQAEAA